MIGLMRFFAAIAVLFLIVASAACDEPDPTPQATPSPTVAAPTPQPPATPNPTVAAPTPQPAATPGPEAGRTTEGIDWFDCGHTFECGRIKVPADYRDPGTGSISIPIIVHRATSRDERIGYLFVNPGGPGKSGIAEVEGVQSGDFSGEIVERFDIVGFDPRGVGYSEPEFACGDRGEQHGLLASIEIPIDTPLEILAGEAAANLCTQSMGPVGGLLHSEYVARDMEEIRRALGAGEISYLGFGYGSTLGLWYATLFPQSVRAMVFDSADNPDDPVGTRQERIDETLEELAPLEARLEEALRACYDPRDCPIYNDGDPIGYFKQAAAKLDLVNRAANNNPYAGFLGVISPLYFDAGWPQLWWGLFYLNENDDPSFLLDWVSFQTDDPSAASFTGHVNCLDGWVLSPLDRQTSLEEFEILAAIIEEQFPLLAATSIQHVPDVCHFYDQFAPDPFEGSLDGGGVPTLVIGNPSDAITSFGESEELVTEALSNGYLVEVSHAKHIVYPENQCVNEHVHRALIDLVYPSERRVMCEQEELHIPGLLPWFPCALNIECMYVSVPADYRDPEAGTIKIIVDVHRATSPDKRIGYLFVNPGGPGVSGVDFVSATEYGLFADEIIERFDIIGFDPRGVEPSAPRFACGDRGEQLALLASIETPADTPEETAAGEAAANLCIESMGPVGGLLHSEYVARDMDEIRKELGADQISYLGYSYGSALGVWYATLFPESVRAMVVDGAANPVPDEPGTPQEQIDELIEENAPWEAQLEAALRACADPTECPIYNDGDPIGYYMQAVSKMYLVTQAANGSPAAGEWGVISALYSEDTWSQLWRGLFELSENDDPSILLDIAKFQLNGDSEFGDPNFTAHVNCLDKWVLQPEWVESGTQLEEVDYSAIGEALPLLTALEANIGSLADICQFYGQFAPEPLERPLDGSDTPILVIGNHSDPATSFVQSEELATEVLSNGYLLETSHYKHGVYPENTCVNDHVHSALIDRVYPSERRAICEREDRLIE